ncbi:hypothetical protein ACTQ6A_14140 [Lachnospiraceae bacterium LCP25S3_G4]
MEISVDAKVFIKEQFGNLTNQEDVCRLYAEYRMFLETQMECMLKTFTEEGE